MEILVANNYLDRTGGTQNYTYAIIAELLRLGHHVEYFTFHKGMCSGKIESLGVPFMSKSHYDLIIANHKPVTQYLFQYGYIIQTTHGIMPGVEEPSVFADYHVCVSEGTQRYLSEKKFQGDIILNGIDCERFRPVTPVHEKLTAVLSLCHSEEANKFIYYCCKKIGVKFIRCNKYKENIWDIEKEINKADLVIGVGRSLYDAMACGRAVIFFDKRFSNQPAKGDGYLDKNNIMAAVAFNCSIGKGNARQYTYDTFITELQKYKRGDGAYMREFALQNLNIRNSVETYLNIYYKNINNYVKNARLIDFYNELNSAINELKSSKSWILTAPLRKIMKIIKQTKRRITNLPKKLLR